MKKLTLSLTFVVALTSLNSCKQKVQPDSLPTQGLLGYYNLNGDANDAQTAANAGAFNNVVATTDRFEKANSALQFNGFSSYVSLPVDKFAFKEYTYSAWVKYDELPPELGYSAIVSVGNVGSDQLLCLGNGLNQIRKGWGGWTYFTNPVNLVGSTFVFDTQLPTSTTKWYHVVATRGSKEYKIYVDSKEVASLLSLGGDSNYPSNNVLARIGSRFDNTFFFKGKIDDVRIYNRALAASEVVGLFNESSK